MSRLRISMVLMFVALPMVVAGAPATANATITVDSTSSVMDFGGARQVNDLPGPDGRVTLHEAITAANNTPGANTIVFQIPTSDPGFNGSDFLLFVEASPGLVLWDDATTIDGSTQLDHTGHRVHLRTTPPYANMNGLTINSDGNRISGLSGFALFRYGIEINGDGNEVTDNLIFGSLSAGIHITGSNNTIGGMTQNAGNTIRSGGNGIWIRPAWWNAMLPAIGNVIQGNVITLNHSNGIAIEDGASGNLIGGTTSAARNVINANGHLSGEYYPVGAEVAVGGSGNVVRGNAIGVDASGTQARGGSAFSGVAVSGSGNIIGGTEPGAGNIISGQGYFSPPLSGRPAGIRILMGSDVTIQGNLIGTDATGTRPLPNQIGIHVADYLFGDAPSNITIGGTEPGAGNVIAFNHMDGIALMGFGEPPRGITISRNSIHSNQELGIDLADDPKVETYPASVTPNDPGDTDAGPNDLQNFPVITAIREGGSSTIVEGTLDTPSPETVTVELFSNRAADPSGFGEGETFRTTARPDAGGRFTAILPGGLSGQFVTATATDAQGDTSEFSRAERVGDQLPPINQPPVAVAAAAPRLGSAPLTEAFDSTGSHDPDGTIVSRQWNLGDGTVTSDANPTHTYPSPGTYTATLTVIDDQGATGIDMVTVTVKANPDSASTLRVAGVELKGRQNRGVTTVSGQVAIVARDGAKVRDATVSVTWTLPTGGRQNRTATTTASGSALFEISGGPGRYTLTVTDVSKEGHVFDRANSQLEVSITS